MCLMLGCDISCRNHCSLNAFMWCFQYIIYEQQITVCCLVLITVNIGKKDDADGCDGHVIVMKKLPCLLECYPNTAGICPTSSNSTFWKNLTEPEWQCHSKWEYITWHPTQVHSRYAYDVFELFSIEFLVWC